MARPAALPWDHTCSGLCPASAAAACESRPRRCGPFFPPRDLLWRTGVQEQSLWLQVKAASGFPGSVPAGAPRTAPPAPLPRGAGALATRCLPTGVYELLGCVFNITFLAISFSFMRVLQYFYTLKKSNLLFPVAFPTLEFRKPFAVRKSDTVPLPTSFKIL